jgi:hypothetical protein
MLKELYRKDFHKVKEKDFILNFLYKKTAKNCENQKRSFKKFCFACTAGIVELFPCPEPTPQQLQAWKVAKGLIDTVPQPTPTQVSQMGEKKGSERGKDGGHNSCDS